MTHIPNKNLTKLRTLWHKSTKDIHAVQKIAQALGYGGKSLCEGMYAVRNYLIEQGLLKTQKK